MNDDNQLARLWVLNRGDGLRTWVTEYFELTVIDSHGSWA